MTGVESRDTQAKLLNKLGVRVWCGHSEMKEMNNIRARSCCNYEGKRLVSKRYIHFTCWIAWFIKETILSIAAACALIQKIISIRFYSCEWKWVRGWVVQLIGYLHSYRQLSMGGELSLQETCLCDCAPLYWLYVRTLTDKEGGGGIHFTVAHAAPVAMITRISDEFLSISHLSIHLLVQPGWLAGWLPACLQAR